MGSSQVQGALWGVEARLWSETLEPTTRPLFEQVLDELGTRGGTRLLDAGCGTGLALQIAAERGAEVAGIGDLLPSPPPGAGGPFALGAPGNLEALVEQADLEPQRADEVAVDFVFASLDDAVRAHLAAGPARRAIDHSGREATADAIRASLESSVQPDGTSVHHNAFRYLIATA